MNAQTEIAKQTIFQAIAAAVAEVKILGKTDRNKFDGYDFVSIDKFLTLVNPINAAHGLFPSVSQTNVEMYENTNSKGGKSTWARFYYDISLHHTNGETFGPVAMMVAVPMNGAQASGSAQSYALKQFFRATYMIPTGDKDDADLNPTEAHHAPKEITPEQFIALRDLIAEKGVSEAAVLERYGAASLEQFPPDQFDKAMNALRATKAKPAPALEDEIPY